MELEVLDGQDEAAARIAELIAGRLPAGGTLAVSGGRTPRLFLERLDLPWDAVDVFQVDERIAPDGSPDRNLTMIRSALLDRAAVRAHPIAVLDDDPAARYEEELRRWCGDPPAIDVVQLGLGSDGHTASLVPDDPVLGVTDRDVAVTDAYMGLRRVTLTYPALDRARVRLWIVTGSDKRDALRRLLEGDASIPAGRVSREDALVVADRAAAP